MENFALTVPGLSGTPMQIQVSGIPSGYTIGGLASGGIRIAMIVGIFLSLIYLLYGGWYWLQSKGDKQNLDKARRIIVYAVVGLIIMSVSMVVVNVISTAVGVKTPIR
jgi:hypothetical protein